MWFFLAEWLGKQKSFLEDLARSIQTFTNDSSSLSTTLAIWKTYLSTSPWRSKSVKQALSKILIFLMRGAQTKIATI